MPQVAISSCLLTQEQENVQYYLTEHSTARIRPSTGTYCDSFMYTHCPLLSMVIKKCTKHQQSCRTEVERTLELTNASAALSEKVVIILCVP